LKRSLFLIHRKVAKDRFSNQQKEAIKNAIVEAELNTSGEIRVHIDMKCPGDPVNQAVTVFQKLKMENTEQRNAVLIYVAMDDHKLAIVGDEGINQVVPDHFWDDERDLMISYFKKGLYTEGLLEGIRQVGEQLKGAFPVEFGDRNELDDEVTFDNEGE
jgi:uncharacterized membrane protein